MILGEKIRLRHAVPSQVVNPSIYCASHVKQILCLTWTHSFIAQTCLAASILLRALQPRKWAVLPAKARESMLQPARWSCWNLAADLVFPVEAFWEEKFPACLYMTSLCFHDALNRGFLGVISFHKHCSDSIGNQLRSHSRAYGNNNIWFLGGKYIVYN